MGTLLNYLNEMISRIVSFLCVPVPPSFLSHAYLFSARLLQALALNRTAEPDVRTPLAPPLLTLASSLFLDLFISAKLTIPAPNSNLKNI